MASAAYGALVEMDDCIRFITSSQGPFGPLCFVDLLQVARDDHHYDSQR